MSLMQTIIAVNEQNTLAKAATLTTQHSLADAPEALRLDYLAACLLACISQPADSPANNLALQMLLQGLHLSEDQQQKIQQDLSGFNADKISQLFAVLREKDLAALYLIDLAWLLLSSDDGLSDEQFTTFNTMAQLLGFSAQMSQVICEFVIARRTANNARLVKVLPLLPDSMTLQTAIPNLLKSCFPFNGLMFGQWIDHGDGTMTDCVSGLMWSRCLLGQTWLDGVVTGDPIETDFPRLIIRNTTVDDDEIGEACHAEYEVALQHLILSQKVLLKDWQLASYDSHFASLQPCFASSTLASQLFVGTGTVGAEFTLVNGGDGTHQYVGQAAKTSHALMFRQWL